MKKLLIILTLLTWLPLAHANQVEFNKTLQAYTFDEFHVQGVKDAS